MVEAWFPEGPDDDGVVLLKVEADSAEYWDSPGGRLATAFSFAKAKLTGERIGRGEREGRPLRRRSWGRSHGPGVVHRPRIARDTPGAGREGAGLSGPVRSPGW